VLGVTGTFLPPAFGEALDKAQESLAEEVAGKIAALEEELQVQSQAHAAYAVQVSKLKDLIKSAETRIREHEREIGVAKTTESVYRATRSISENIGQGGNKLVSARESLDRIKARHEDLADRMAATEQLDNEFGHGALEKKLATAGIGDESRRQSAVMDRIRAKRQSAAAEPEKGAS
jgi:phage shock protein A